MKGMREQGKEKTREIFKNSREAFATRSELTDYIAYSPARNIIDSFLVKSSIYLASLGAGSVVALSGYLSDNNQLIGLGASIGFFGTVIQGLNTLFFVPDYLSRNDKIAQMSAERFMSVFRGIRPYSRIEDTANMNRYLCGRGDRPDCLDDTDRKVFALDDSRQ